MLPPNDGAVADFLTWEQYGLKAGLGMEAASGGSLVLILTSLAVPFGKQCSCEIILVRVGLAQEMLPCSSSGTVLWAFGRDQASLVLLVVLHCSSWINFPQCKTPVLLKNKTPRNFSLFVDGI